MLEYAKVVRVGEEKSNIFPEPRNLTGQGEETSASRLKPMLTNAPDARCQNT